MCQILYVHTFWSLLTLSFTSKMDTKSFILSPLVLFISFQPCITKSMAVIPSSHRSFVIRPQPWSQNLSYTKSGALAFRRSGDIFLRCCSKNHASHPIFAPPLYSLSLPASISCTFRTNRNQSSNTTNTIIFTILLYNFSVTLYKQLPLYSLFLSPSVTYTFIPNTKLVTTSFTHSSYPSKSCSKTKCPLLHSLFFCDSVVV